MRSNDALNFIAQSCFPARRQFIWHDERMWWHLSLLAAAAPNLTAQLAIDSGADMPVVVLDWSVRCEPSPQDPPGTAVPVGVERIMRYAAGDGNQLFLLTTDDAAGQDRLVAQAGSRVVGSVRAQCAVGDVVSEAVSMTTDEVVVAPRLLAPRALLLASGEVVPVEPVPVGVPVTLVDVGVELFPQAGEEAVVRIEGVGIAYERTLAAGDVPADTHVVLLSPILTASSVGEIRIQASFMGVDAIPIVLTAAGGNPDDVGEGEGEGEDGTPALAGRSCASAPPLLLLFLSRLRRRSR
jgi:hypothetical protein